MEFSFSSLDMCWGAAGDDRACGGSLDEEPWLRLIDLLPDKLRVALVDSTFGVNSCELVLFAVVVRHDVPLERTHDVGGKFCKWV